MYLLYVVELGSKRYHLLVRQKWGKAGGDTRKDAHTNIRTRTIHEGGNYHEKLFKKLAAVVIAACMCAALAVPMEGSADTVTPGDLNGDGYINTNDASILQGYLNGSCELINPGTADIDQDYVITSKDTYLLTRYLAQNTSLPTQGSALAMPAMESRTYLMYDYETETKSRYRLYADVSELSLENEAAPAADYVDDRDESTETAVVMVGSGSGFIIDDNVIATAAHCVYDVDSSSFVPDLKVTVKNADCTMLRTVDVKEAHIFTTYTSTDNPCKYDYALVYVEEDLSAFGKFELALPTDEFMTSNSEVVVSGFPSSVQGDPVSGVRYNTTGNIEDIREYDATLWNYQIKYSTYVSGGQSGGPVYIKRTYNDEEKFIAIGVNTSGSDEIGFFGTRMTPTLLRFYKNNSYIGSTVS